MSDVRNQNLARGLIGVLIMGPISAIIGGAFGIASRESPMLASAIELLADAIKKQSSVIFSAGQAPAERTITKESLTNLSAEQVPAEYTFTEVYLANDSSEPSPAIVSALEYLAPLPIKLPEEVLTNNLEILDFLEPDNKDDIYVRAEKFAQLLVTFHLYRDAISFYDFLAKQTVLSEGRRALHQKNLEYVIGRWVSSVGFIHDIADNLVTAVVIEDPDPTVIGKHVNVRQDPVIGDNIIESFDFNEEVQIIGRSDSRQQIDGGLAYWYKIYRTSDGTEGWIYGRFLAFNLHT